MLKANTFAKGSDWESNPKSVDAMVQRLKDLGYEKPIADLKNGALTGYTGNGLKVYANGYTTLE